MPQIPAPATSRLLHPSAAGVDVPLSTDVLAAIAGGLAAVVDEGSAACEGPVGPGQVRRRRVVATAGYDAWIVELGPRTRLEPHDHGGSIGVIGVTSGELVEFALDDDGTRRSRLRRLVAGDTTQFGITQRHSLVNTGATVAISVQVFSPPLSSAASPAERHHQLNEPSSRTSTARPVQSPSDIATQVSASPVDAKVRAPAGVSHTTTARNGSPP